MTGLAFAHGTVADLTAPSSMPAHLLAFKKSTTSGPANDSALRSAIVNSANYYLRLAQGSTPAEIEALIWQNDSLDGVDHGESCAAFASLTLEAGAQSAGQQSWVSGGTTYPWPLHAWVDARVDPNPASLGITSILQDAQAHNRWHPLGDGYTPQPGDWVLFSGHVEVVTKYAGGVLYTIGGDSMPNLSVNAHQYGGPLGAQGVAGFVNNGELLSAVRQPPTPPSRVAAPIGGQPQGKADPAQTNQPQTNQPQPVIPGLVAPALMATTSDPQTAGTPTEPVQSSGAQPNLPGAAAIPGAPTVTGNFTHAWSTTSTPRYSRSQPPASAAAVPDTAAQQAFINEVATGAVKAQQRYGIPAAVTIAQAIDESGWGQSRLATQDNNLFGIKGTGPAGSVSLPSQEYLNGQWVTMTAPFRVYNNVAESIDDHSLLLATGSSYKQAMADRKSPDAFANDLTGVYATDPSYGANLIRIMRLYNLYRYDTGSTTPQAAPTQNSTRPGSASPTGTSQATTAQGATGRRATGQRTTGQRATAQRTPAQRTTGQGTTVQRTPGKGTTGQREPGQGGYGATPLGLASIPGAVVTYPHQPLTSTPSPDAAPGQPAGPRTGPVVRTGPRNGRVRTKRYQAQIPSVVTTDFIATAKAPLLRAQPLYQDVASRSGIRWELLAACDWMQCQAQPRYSPVHGEKLGTVNTDGTVYRTKSEALEQAACDLIVLASAVYRIDLIRRIQLSVSDLANVFAAFRWGGLLRAHHISAMEFPYSVAGLTGQHMKMRWPDIREPQAPDKPGSRFRGSFGAVPVVLGLDFPALA
jgi:flagellum-specific peptidoglycan hydrolase FlgJ